MKRAETIGAACRFDTCPVCQCTAFYRQKDFNHALGCVFLAVGFVLVPWTYGLSLPALWLLDMALRRRVPDMAVCYRCRAAFRGGDIPAHIGPFEHFTAMKWEPRDRTDLRQARPADTAVSTDSGAGMKNSSSVLNG